MGDGSFKGMRDRLKVGNDAAKSLEQVASDSQGGYRKGSSKTSQNKPTGLTHTEVGWGKNLKE